MLGSRGSALAVVEDVAGACFVRLRMSVLMDGAGTDGAGAATGKAATDAAGLPVDDGAEGRGLAVLDAMLALEGALLIEDAGDLEGVAAASEDGNDSLLAWRL